MKIRHTHHGSIYKGKKLGWVSEEQHFSTIEVRKCATEKCPEVMKYQRFMNIGPRVYAVYKCSCGHAHNVRLEKEN